MKIFFDTSVLVDLDRQREATLGALEEATRTGSPDAFRRTVDRARNHGYT